MELKIREMSDRLAATNEDIQKSLTQSNTMTEHISLSLPLLYTEVIYLPCFLSYDDDYLQEATD